MFIYLSAYNLKIQSFQTLRKLAQNLHYIIYGDKFLRRDFYEKRMSIWYS